MLASAMTVPRKLAPLSVADVPTRQKMLHGSAEPATLDVTFMVSVVATLNTKIPGPSSVSVVPSRQVGRRSKGIDARGERCPRKTGAQHRARPLGHERIVGNDGVRVRLLHDRVIRSVDDEEGAPCPMEESR